MSAAATQHSQSDAQLRELRTRLNKHILKLVFSHLGRDKALDATIKQFKQSIQQNRDDDKRDALIEQVIADILAFLDNMERATDTSGDAQKDLFADLLKKLSLSHPEADEFVELHERMQKIEQRQDQISLINDTIRLLSNTEQVSTADENDFILSLIDIIDLPRAAAIRLEKLKQQIYKTGDDDNNKSLLPQLSLVLNDANETLQAEVNDIRQYIGKVVGQLGELNTFITSSIRHQTLSYDESRKLNREFIKRNESLQTKIDSSSDLEEIKQVVNTHLSVVNENIQSHLDIEMKRYNESNSKLKSVQKELQGMSKQCDTLKKKLNKARQDALHDALTGLPNRLAFDERINEEITRFQRYGNPMSLAVIDIDHFKHVNDTYGHKAGDKVLKAMAGVSSERIRKTDFLARFGGEEFVLLMPETDIDKALEAMNGLREVIEECHFHYSDQTVPITVSIGIAMFYADDNYDSVFKRADAALYAAKGAGRNQCITEQQLESAA